MAERLQKILSAAGIASRRTAETLIAQGRVTVNGRTVTEPGTKASLEDDDIRVDDRRVKGVAAPPLHPPLQAARLHHDALRSRAPSDRDRSPGQGRCQGVRLSGRAPRLRLGRTARADERRRTGGAADASSPWHRARIRSARARRARSARSGSPVARHLAGRPADGAGGRRADQGDRRGEADSRRCCRSSFAKGATGRCATCATRSGIRWSGSGASASARSPTSTFARGSSGI